eukprot:7708650-Pyramimonas_sp.AAC.2
MSQTRGFPSLKVTERLVNRLWWYMVYVVGHDYRNRWYCNLPERPLARALEPCRRTATPAPTLRRCGLACFARFGSSVQIRGRVEFFGCLTA